MKRLPTLLSLVFFLALCASLAYWLLQWLAPQPHPVAAPPVAERSLPPLASAANLFGGSAHGNTLASVQLRGVIRAGRAGDSVAIIATEGRPPRALKVDAEIEPGLILKEIHVRTVVLSDKGAERELTLPPFAAQSGGTAEISVPANVAMPGASPVAQQSGTQAISQGSTGIAAQSPVAQGGVAAASGPSSTASSTASNGAGEPAMQAPRPEMRSEGSQRR